MRTTIDSFLKKIKSDSKVLISVHKDPDLDAVGSAIALKKQLERLSILCTLWIPGGLDDNFDFLPLDNHITQTTPSIDSYNMLIVLDCSDLNRIPDFHLLNYSPDRITTINIDHHNDNSQFGGINIVDGEISSTGELLYNLFRQADWSIDSEIATCLYASIVFDTGRFHYSNVSSKTLYVASKLIELGADNYKISQQIFENKTENQLKHLKTGLDTLVVNQLKRYAYSKLPFESRESGHDIIDFIRNLKGIDVFLVFRDYGENQVKINLRSKSAFDVSLFARKFGGGGHKQAAGLTMTGNFEDTVNLIISELEQNIE